MLTTYRRHLKKCEHRGEGRTYRRCHCPIWVDGFIGGAEVRQSLQLRDWQKAQDKIREWEAEGEQPTEQPTATKTIAEASSEFLEDCRARALKDRTLEKYTLLLGRLQRFGEDQGLKYLKDCDLAMLRKFRAGWKLNPLSALKTLDRLRTFTRFCVDSEWIGSNVANKIIKPTVVQKPTPPFEVEEMRDILAACHKYPGRLIAVRLRALVLLLRYSGLRICDGVTLERTRIKNGNLFLYTEKTGTPVWCPLPPFVIEALDASAANARYFFWTGEGQTKTVVRNYQEALYKLFALAGVHHGHPHRFRDTFAVELLLKNVPIERVARLLGHKSIAVTERHYSAWVRARQQQLEADVRRTWETDLLTLAETNGTPEVHGKVVAIN